MKKIVFITSSLGFAGAEKMLVFVANSLSEIGHDCTIINLNAIGEYINEKKQNVSESIKIHTLNKFNDSSRHRRRLKIIEEIGKDFKADVIIGFMGWPNFYAKIVGTKLHIPSIICERGDPSRTTPKTLKSKVVRFFINRSKGAVFQTEGAKRYYGRGLQKRGVVIPNPIFVDGDILEIPFEQKEKSVVTVGRLDNEQKRYDVMIKAFKLFLEKHPEYILKIYGKGPDEEQIKELVHDVGISESVKFMGLSRQPMQDIARDGIFLITSDYEGISNSLLEAMAVGMPCVSTDHTPGGAKLLINDHENGLLAPVGDFQSIARALCEFAEDECLAIKCGNNAKSVLVRFSPKEIIYKWDYYISELCR